MPDKKPLTNTIQTTSDGDLLSNYLLALGKSETIDIIKNIFNDKNEGESETSIVNIQNGFSLLSVSKSECLQEINNSVAFFRGWFQDHHSQSIVLGEKGYAKWLNNNQKLLGDEYEGSYISAAYNNEKIIIRNDLFSYLPVIYLFVAKPPAVSPLRSVPFSRLATWPSVWRHQYVLLLLERPEAFLPHEEFAAVFDVHS